MSRTFYRECGLDAGEMPTTLAVTVIPVKTGIQQLN
jgi:hypothetical protein